MSNFWIVLKKELVDIFRDRKTLIFTILLPIIMYPAMFKIIDFTMKDTTESIQKNVAIAYRGQEDSSIHKILKNMKNITIDNSGNVDEKLKKGDISLIVDVPEDFDSKVAAEGSTNIKIIYDQDSNKSSMASSMIKDTFDKYSKSVIDGRLQAKGIDSQLLTPFEIKEQTLSKQDNNPIAFGILSVLPTLLIIFMISPTIGIAADLVAGEKERGTFEPLLSTAVGRMSIFGGKLMAISSVALVTLIVTLASMIGSMLYIFSDGGGVTISPGAFVVMGVVSVFVLIALSSIEISISIFARSMKEANTYLGGFIVPVMILTYVPFMMDAKNIGFLFFNIPIVNAVVVMKEAIAGIFNPMHISVVLGWHVVYVIATVLLAKVMFSKEEVVFRS
ncbi:ABC transporter permease [Clostridium luticellarii]|jgi:sodium transport system permease protein|uniref:Inner membrane transport permease YbhR n=1 Tax=Clostridium luticellarii TaxID=1691940 RepID=A0A2T0BME0_9CLOT|nr:ABC transporter permease [Clostridium luticellarii]MCI1944994.1 ABC transporter permease [Clostridium luticellarii]MCI1967856.1 ABC transporter permease [Clostridium luticellarii]MCI1995774.1 ABC transporter permease [Clostridium luticellarii]MCI2040913.1 ABC transporter permease [Clostridium luticellarii]PRR85046.1 Inner membrane transport permease YbhR [Clostridium luticellarii]